MERDVDLGTLLYRSFGSFAALLLANLRAPEYASIRPRHLAVLSIVEAEPVRASAIAEALRVTPAAVTQALNELEGAGFVIRTPDPHDRRAKLVAMTVAGNRLAAHARRAVAQAEARFRSELGAERYEALRAALERIDEAASRARARRRSA